MVAGQVVGRRVLSALVAAAALCVVVQDASAQYRRPYAPCQPCPSYPPRYTPPRPGDLPSEAPKPGEKEKDPTDPTPEDQTDTPDLTADQTAPTVAQATGYESTGSPMLGDSLGPCGGWLAGSGFSSVGIPVCPGGGRFKISSNQSPLPQDRLYFNFQHYSNAQEITKSDPVNIPRTNLPLSNTSKNFDVRQYTLGAESTCLCGMASVQLQVPFFSKLSSDIPPFEADPSSELPGTTDTELGNVALVFKGLLYNCCNLMVSGGLGVELPTGDDVSLQRDIIPTLGFVDTLDVENEAVILSPYLGFFAPAGQYCFLHGFAQWSLPTNDNSFRYRSVNHFLVLRAPPATVALDGDMVVQSLLNLDLGLGVVLVDDPCAVVNRATAMLELHYMTTTEDSDLVILSDPFFAPQFGEGTLGSIGNPANRQDFLNLTAGVDVRVHSTTIRPAVVVPLRDGDDKLFDYEFILQVNRFF